MTGLSQLLINHPQLTLLLILYFLFCMPKEIKMKKVLIEILFILVIALYILPKYLDMTLFQSVDAKWLNYILFTVLVGKPINAIFRLFFLKYQPKEEDSEGNSEDVNQNGVADVVE